MPDPLAKLGPELVGLIRLSSALNAKDINFYKSIDSGIKQQSDTANAEILSLLNKAISSAVTTSTDMEPADFVVSEDNDVENMKIISNVLDSLFDGVESGLGHHYSKKNGASVPSSSSIDDGYTYLDENDAKGTPSTSKLPHINVPKPQLQFGDRVDNTESHPFKPWITAKPNAIVPFEKSMQLVPAEDGVPEHYNNPYSYEIENQKYPEWIFEEIDQWEPIPWKESPDPIWIDQPGQLDELLLEMHKCKVIGVDLEHHDYRTYYGLTSLMQITTETHKDYLLDPLSPQLLPHLSVLNEVFTDPSIVKVFHGAFMDMVWLQRDLGLYVVSLFDTYHASRELLLPRHGLAFLLEKYSHFRTSKKWQLADWRLRPLNNEMRNYAKADTHFLIEVFTRMQADLLKKPGSLQKVLYASRKVADRRFEYSTFKPSGAGAEVVSTNNSVPLTPEFQDDLFSLNHGDTQLPWSKLMLYNNIDYSKFPVVEALFKWRDQRAREEDESIKYVMSDFVLTSLANAFDASNLEQLNETNVLNEINRSARFGSSSYVRKYLKDISELLGQVWHKVSKIKVTTAAPNVKKGANVYESVLDVERLQNEFADFSNKFKKLNFPNVSESEYKLEQAPDSTILGIEYSKKGTKIVDSKELEARLAKAKSQLQPDSVVVDIEPESETEQTSEPESEELEEVPESTNEIVTLRKHNKSRYTKVTANADEQLDLSKKVLQPLQHDRKQKKRSFNPYAAASEQNPDIARVRKRKRRDIGKGAVFKK